MLNIPELEERWFKYKLKSYLPYVVIAISIITISIIVSTVLKETSSDQNSANKILKNNTYSVFETLNDSNADSNTQYTSSPLNSNANMQNQQNTSGKQVKLSPSMNFMKNMQNYAEPYYATKTPKYNKKPKKISKPLKNDEIEIEEIVEEIVAPEKQIVEEQPKKIFIQRRNTQNDVNKIIKRFKKNNNPSLSLFIAKKYYDMGNYHQSYNYALITNQINKEIEASWLIFAKSLVKLGKKNMAIKTLEEYVKSSHSSSAKILLNNIKSGKFQ